MKDFQFNSEGDGLPLKNLHEVVSILKKQSLRRKHRREASQNWEDA